MMNKDTQDRILSGFSDHRGVYADLALTVANLLEQVLKREGLQLHSVTNRCKEPVSLSRKLQKPEKDYGVLADVTDLAGVRITTYFAADVDKVSDLIEREFDIDRENSVD